MGKEHSFTVVIETCGEGGYFGTCPAIPGCHVQGETFEEVIGELKEAIRAMAEGRRRTRLPLHLRVIGRRDLLPEGLR